MFKRSRQSSSALSDPSLVRVQLTPQMLDYDDFASRGYSQYLPYIMSFNRANFQSASINTDRRGFRYSNTIDGQKVSATELGECNTDSVNILVGGSVPLGYGATSDSKTMTSVLAELDPDGKPWINMSGHCFNPSQELILYIMNQNRLPNIDNITILSGFNALAMGRIPEHSRGGMPPFYFCGEYYGKFDEIAKDNGGSVSGGTLPKWPSDVTAIPPIEETIIRAVDDTAARLAVWAQLASAIGAKITYLLQPLAPWVRDPCSEEEKLFTELDTISRLGTWNDLYGDISSKATAKNYSKKIAEVCRTLGVKYGNVATDLAQVPNDDWLYVDRAHLTDFGNHLVAKAIHQHIHQ